MKITEGYMKNVGLDLKYDAMGIYGIYMDEELVYIGQSKNMLKRICNHIRCILNPEKGKEKKYVELRKATNIRFDVLLYVKNEKDLNKAELDLIHKYQPRLNTVGIKKNRFEKTKNF